MCSALPCARAHASLPVVDTDDRFSYTRPPMVQEALDLLEREVRNSDVLTSPGAVRDYLRLLLGDRPHEVFAVVFLDAQHRVLDTLEMFRGTLTQSSVYPREILVEALARKAAAVLLAHNHPSGVAEPSGADQALTQKLQAALAMVDVRVLDHFVIARGELVSFAERGLL
jgi:DNA repair protein RadC